MNRDIIVNDDEISDAGDRFVSIGRELERCLASYIKILKECRENGVMTGATGDALTLFIDAVCMSEGKISEISQRLKETCDSYVTEINDADSYLF